jgi:hypothetical protein
VKHSLEIGLLIGGAEVGFLTFSRAGDVGINCGSRRTAGRPIDWLGVCVIVILQPPSRNNHQPRSIVASGGTSDARKLLDVGKNIHSHQKICYTGGNMWRPGVTRWN